MCQEALVTLTMKNTEKFEYLEKNLVNTKKSKLFIW
jgi:hypothetical protein